MPRSVLSAESLSDLAVRHEMTVLVFSDSHGSESFILNTVARFPAADLIIHLGDHGALLSGLSKNCPIPMIGVAGNCDGWAGRHLPDQLLLVLAGQRVFATHGHLQGVKQQLDRLLAIGANEPNSADIILFGHTHRPTEKTFDYRGRPIMLLNPGSCRPGCTSEASALVLQLQPGKIVCDFVLDLP